MKNIIVGESVKSLQNTKVVGPQPIGALEVPFEWKGTGIDGEIKRAVRDLKRGYPELTNSDLKRSMVKDFTGLVLVHGKRYFLASKILTMALENDGQGILVEIRRPNEKYIRGRINTYRRLTQVMEVEKEAQLLEAETNGRS
jgi:hypothetical protein